MSSIESVIIELNSHNQICPPDFPSDYFRLWCDYNYGAVVKFLKIDPERIEAELLQLNPAAPSVGEILLGALRRFKLTADVKDVKKYFGKYLHTALRFARSEARRKNRREPTTNNEGLDLVPGRESDDDGADLVPALKTFLSREKFKDLDRLIIQRLEQGKYPAEIARELGYTRSHISARCQSLRGRFQQFFSEISA